MPSRFNVACIQCDSVNAVKSFGCWVQTITELWRVVWYRVEQKNLNKVRLYACYYIFNNKTVSDFLRIKFSPNICVNKTGLNENSLESLELKFQKKISTRHFVWLQKFSWKSWRTIIRIDGFQKKKLRNPHVSSLHLIEIGRIAKFLFEENLIYEPFKCCGQRNIIIA